MIREFKFRLPHFKKDKSFSHFSYWGTIDYKNEPSLDHGCFISPGSTSGFKGWHQPWTGLLDKNKQYVFEGDVVNVTNKASYNGKKVVVWDDTLLCYVLVWFDEYPNWKGTGKTGINFLKVSSGIKCELVGHVFEAK